MDYQNRGVPPVPPWVQNERVGIPDARMRQDQPEVKIEPPKIEPPPGAEPYYPEVDEEERFQYALNQAFNDPDPEEMRARLFGARALSELTGLSLKDAFDGSYNLSDIFTGEKTMKGFWKRVKNDVDYNWKLQSQIVPLYLRLLNGDESPELLEQIAKTESSIGMPPSMEGRGILEKMIGGAASQMPMYLKSTAQGAKVGIGVAALAALAAVVGGQFGPQVALPEEVITAPGLGALGFRMGFKVGSAHYMTEMMAALTYRDLMQMRDKNGKPVDPNTARAVAWGVGIIQGLVEQSQFQMFTKSLGIAQKASNAMVGRSVFRTLTNSRLINLVLETAKFVGAETAEEILQEVAAIGGEELMKELENYKGADFDRATTGAALQRLLSTAIQSGIAIMGMGLPGAAIKFGPSVVRDIKTLSESKQFADLVAQSQQAVPITAAPKEQAPRITFEQFKQNVDAAFPTIRPERKQAYYTVLEKLGNKLGMTLDEVASTLVEKAEYGREISPNAFHQMSAKAMKFAKDNGYLNEVREETTNGLALLNDIDSEIGKLLGHKPKNATNINWLLQDRPEMVERIREIEKLTGVKVLKEGTDNIIPMALEERVKSDTIVELQQGVKDAEILLEKRKGQLAEAEASGDEKRIENAKQNVKDAETALGSAEHKVMLKEAGFEIPEMPMLGRAFAQTFLDQMGDDEFEKLRGGMVRAMEEAAKLKKEGNLPNTFAVLFPEMEEEEGTEAQTKELKRKIGAVGPSGESKYIAAPLKKAQKTLAALNLSTCCPMFHIGSRGCYLDGCYVTAMAKAGSNIVYYHRGMYTGEILQLSPDMITALNRVGGLRINGQGDLTQTAKAQLRDILKHAGMVGLKLKIITKQTDVVKMMQDLQNDPDTFVKWKAMTTVVQTSVDPYWVPATSDMGGGVKEMQFNEVIAKAKKNVYYRAYDPSLGGADFEPSKDKGMMGIHFGTREQADAVAKDRGGAVVVDAFELDIKNPLRVTDRQANDPVELGKELLSSGLIDQDRFEEISHYTGRLNDRRMINLVKSLGYDALVYANEAEGEGDSVVILDRSQVKKATTLKAIQDELIAYYKSLGRDAKLINGEVYRKYGFSSDQIKSMAQKYADVNIQVRAVLATPKEIAEFALHTPDILQTWMHAKLPDGIYSDTEGGIIDVAAGNYTERIAIFKDEGDEWRVQAQDKDAKKLHTRPDYQAVEDYIKENYPEQADQIFRTLAGQVEEHPGTLCCSAGASADACNDCASLCQQGAHLNGKGLEEMMDRVQAYRLFQDERGEVEFVEDGRAIIRGFESADISTLIHETAHIFRRTLEGQMLKDAEEFCGVVNGVWEREHEERFATAFEEYMATQEAPTTGLKAVFEQFKQWLYDIYQGVRSTLTPKMKAVFDSMFADELQKDEKDDVSPEEFPATRQEIASQIKNTKQRIRYLTGQVKVSELVKETDAMKEAYKKAAKSYKEGLKEGKAIERKKQQEKRYVKQMREYAKRLAKYLTKPVSKTIDHFYAETVEAIGEGIDPKFRSNKKLAEIEARKAFLEKHADRVEDMPRKLLEEMNKKDLNDITVNDLERMVAERRHLEQVGRMKLRLKEAQKKRSRATHLDENINTINNGQPQAVREGNIKEFVGKRVWRGWQAWNLRIMRIADWLDGGMGFKGPNHDYLYNRVNRFVNAAMKMQDQRRTAVTQKANELGIMRMLGRVERIGEFQYTHDQIIDIYMGMQNKKKAAAIVYGNILRHAPTWAAEDAVDLVGQFIDRLSEDERRFGDFLIDEYEKNYARLRAAFIAFTNLDLGKEDRYSPIHRMDADYGEDLPEQLSKELLEHSDFHRAFAERGFTIDRKEIPNEYQLEITLGALSTWASQAEKQEHFIHGAQVISDLQWMVNNDAYKTAVREKLGGEFVRVLQDYANRVANPNIYKTYSSIERVSRIARNNFAISALSFNIVTMLKQLPSVFFFIADAGPIHFIGAAAQFAFQPGKIIRFANEQPQLKARSLDRFTEELKQVDRGWYDRLVKAVGTAGMRPIYWMDKAAVSIGYKAVYDKCMEQYNDDTLARQEALNSVLRTQPAAHPKDIARVYAHSEWINWFLMFTNQLNQMYNMVSYDIPKSRKKVGGGMAHAFWTITGLTLSALAIWSITHKRLPEDEDDMKEAMSEQFWSMIPVIGSIYLSMKRGWGSALELPLAGPLEGILGIVDTLMRREMPNDREMRTFFEAIGRVSGFPVVATKRIYKFLDTGEPIELIGGKPKEKK